MAPVGHRRARRLVPAHSAHAALGSSRSARRESGTKSWPSLSPARIVLSGGVPLVKGARADIPAGQSQGGKSSRSWNGSSPAAGATPRRAKRMLQRGHGEVDAAADVGLRGRARPLVAVPSVSCQARRPFHATGFGRHLCAVLYALAMGDPLFEADGGPTPSVAGHRARAAVRGGGAAACPPLHHAAELSPAPKAARSPPVMPVQRSSGVLQVIQRARSGVILSLRSTEGSTSLLPSKNSSMNRPSSSSCACGTSVQCG